MRTPLLSLCTILLWGFVATLAHGQLPNLPIPGGSGTASRDPDDQIEGGIWEYKGTLEKSNAKDKKDEPSKLEGKFRIEGSAVFDVSPTFKIPSKKEVDKVIDKVKSGEGVELKLPAGPQQKRLGEYRKISGGKIRIDFNDKESLSGIMILWKKKKTDDVWMGTFSQREDDKEVRSWSVQLRPIED